MEGSIGLLVAYFGCVAELFAAGMGISLIVDK